MHMYSETDMIRPPPGPFSGVFLQYNPVDTENRYRHLTQELARVWGLSGERGRSWYWYCTFKYTRIYYNKPI